MEMRKNIPTSRLPNLIIAGVNRAGSTSVFQYLSLHPDICRSSVKETCYFLPVRYGEPLPPFEQYKEYFAHCGNQKYIMEATPGYFYGGKDLADVLKTRLGNPKVLIIFREPVDRLWSFFRFHKNMLNLDKHLSFEDYLQTYEEMGDGVEKHENHPFFSIRGGFYSNYLPNWHKVFGESLKVVFFENLKKDRKGFVQDVCQWLELDSGVYDSVTLNVENKSVSYKVAKLHKIAIGLNRAAEKVLRDHQVVKDLIRRAYYAINGTSNVREKPREETVEELKSIYTPYNHRLKEQLTAMGYNSLPEWIGGETL